MSGKRKLEIVLAGDASGLNRTLDSASTSAGKFGGAMRKVGRAASLAFVAVGTAAVAVAVKSLTSFASFQDQMNEVYTLLPGLSDKAMDAMADDVKKFAVKFGVLPDKVIPALYQALSAGVPKKNVFEFLETAQKAAAAGVTDLETAVDGITSTINAYGQDVISATEASDLMFTAVKAGKTTFEELSQALFNVNPIASALGVKFADVTAALASMTSQGVPTSVATTQLRQLFVELSKAGGDTADTFEDLAGKSFKEFVAAGGTTQEALQLLEEHAADTGVGINDLFGSVEAGSAALALTGKGTETFTENMAAMGDAAGATDTAYSQMQTGLSKSLDRLKAAFAVLAIEIGERLAPVVDAFAKWLEEKLPGALKKSGKFFRDHLKKPLLKVIGVLGDLITDIGEKGLIGVLKDLPGPAQAAAAAVAALGIAIWAALAPISLIVVGLAAVGVAVYAAQKRFPAFKRAIENTVDYVKEHWPEVEETIGKGVVAIQGVISAFVAVGTELWATFGGTIIRFTTSTWTNIREYISGVLGVIRGIIKTVTSLISGDWSDAWDGIKQTVLGAWKAINAIVGQAVALTTVILSLAWDTIAGTATAVWDTIKDTVLGAVNTVVDKVNTAITWLSIAWGTVWGGMSSAVLGIWDGITAIVEGGVNAVIGAINAIIRAWNRLEFHTPHISVLGFSAPSFDWESPNIDEFSEVGRGRAGRSAGGATTVNVVINAGLGTDQRELRRTVAKALIEYASANGGIPLKIRSV